MNHAYAAKAYATVGAESGAISADPHKLILMLYQGALLAIANGKNAILRKDIPTKGKSISHAISIIGEGLNASLDKDVGGELALNLSALYDYMIFRLTDASLNNDTSKLDEVTTLLRELKEAWESIRPVVVPVARTTMPAPQIVPKEKMQLTYGKV